MLVPRGFLSLDCIFHLPDCHQLSVETIIALQVSVKGWLEAFDAHPKIGDVEGLKKKFGGFAAMSKNEQSGAAQAAPTEIQVRAEKDFAEFCASSNPTTSSTRM